MFGISFTELLVVGLIALLVLGPERLPGAARTAGLWIGRIKRSFNAIKTEVEREIGADEIRRQLHNEHILGLEKEMQAVKNDILPPSKPAPQAETPLPTPQTATAGEPAPVAPAPPPIDPVSAPTPMPAASQDKTPQP
ncbi:Sec-independent protein translocase protein TatB [Pseudomonas seleniipraecipitans]|jgi:sec-independent protein translocase protein TatB|uniref:Sec-independent protein translocase protein TatB n=1 Tax=Phytopseudomonas seleniipraecipitans TaxID=640205 RepID=A0A1G7PN54_9GAMM|nr:Sec-independent protein translocase protein TatB [Pseudomonas seleniipraecipitans]NQD78794.1 Sec-independent protein translocase subunit TatB [Pseudomonas sp. CrR14]UUD65975.1 Sec-independent protein translocase protein TatB [Pseudomonas seleniipraecipitans]SDF87616.1 sec-independent protein translocase protein TatB [Pseudomonas seleniipraecipitans]